MGDHRFYLVVVGAKSGEEVANQLFSGEDPGCAVQEKEGQVLLDYELPGDDRAEVIKLAITYVSRRLGCEIREFNPQEESLLDQLIRKARHGKDETTRQNAILNLGIPEDELELDDPEEQEEWELRKQDRINLLKDLRQDSSPAIREQAITALKNLGITG
ncbi:hypothetical protein BVX98_00670 [bacterium F11]|nr:hypothetical protein BVX98_00670 [bacterium F11]